MLSGRRAGALLQGRPISIASGQNPPSGRLLHQSRADLFAFVSGDGHYTITDFDVAQGFLPERVWMEPFHAPSSRLSVPPIRSYGAQSAVDDGHFRISGNESRHALFYLGDSAVEHDEQAADVGTSFGVRRLLETGRLLFAHRHEPAAEIALLRRELERVRLERDILKKAISIFPEAPR
ncbi:transposase [Azospirillum melinis]|uniref:transposase n=1 Tax=Azospirillum melinis TaxID=328839 RepID=UPI003757731B